MNYKDAFVIDSVAYNKRKEVSTESYQLNNFDYYNPKLINDFYLKYFTKVLLFEIDILELEDFIEFHYCNCENPNRLLKIFELKITAKIDEIISNAIFSLDGESRINTINLEFGLVERENFIFHPLHEDSFFYYTTALNNLQENLEKRKTIINDYISKVNESNDSKNPEVLKWKGKPSHLAFIVRELIQQGFIEAPKLPNNEINLTQLSRLIINTFSYDSHPSRDTFRRYLDVNSEKHQSLEESFKNAGFNIPDSGLVS